MVCEYSGIWDCFVGVIVGIGAIVRIVRGVFGRSGAVCAGGVVLTDLGVIGAVDMGMVAAGVLMVAGDLVDLD